MIDVESAFKAHGGEFIADYQTIVKKLTHIKLWLFDWDGVFNNGVKDEQTGSVFAEPDAAGTNYLRFGYWLKNERQMPLSMIMTGANNPAAFRFAEREHFDAVYLKTNNKTDAIKHLEKQFGIQHSQIAFVFDDVLDLGVASLVGLRFLIRRKASPLFTNFVKNRNLADYITANTGAEQGVREVCELVLGMYENFDQVLDERLLFSDTYKNFLAERNSTIPAFFVYENGEIRKR
jgi:3-deoxy-D-manno-octulosonate 8-phosphate phosphatase (KDO 8-P phosphatase)